MDNSYKSDTVKRYTPYVQGSRGVMRLLFGLALLAGTLGLRVAGTAASGREKTVSKSVFVCLVRRIAAMRIWEGGKGISRRCGRLPIRQVGFSVMENCQQAESSLFRQC